MTIEQAELLLASKEFQQLKYFQEKTNVFTIVGQTHTEHWHSSFMSWLLDPGSSLCLGHYPLVRLLTLYMIKNEKAELSLKEIFDMKLDDVQEKKIYRRIRGERPAHSGNREQGEGAGEYERYGGGPDPGLPGLCGKAQANWAEGYLPVHYA